MNAMQQLLTKHMAIWTAADTEKKSGRGRSSGDLGSVYGIKKLRELILELAVQGKLLQQNYSDEPASELLKRIEAETGKSIAKISSSEEPFHLPNNWKWLKLGDCSGIERGGSPRPIQDFITNDTDGLNWIKIGDTDKNSKYITSTNEKIKKEGLVKTRMVYPGDFLLTNSMSFGRPYITKIQGCIHDGWLRIHPPSSIEKDYLYNLLLSPYVYTSFKNSAAGAVVQNLNADKVRDLLIPLPPLAEQQRIVSKIDELMALCDQLEMEHSKAAEAHEKLVSHLLDTLTQSQSADDFTSNWQRIAKHFDTLFTTETSIDNLKQTLLQLAVMGRLVPQETNDEPASELLKRIKSEKTKMILEGKIKKDRPLASIANIEKPFDLPNGWEWARLGELVNILNGRAYKKEELLDEGTPVLRVGNLFTSDKWYYSDLTLDEDKYCNKGDLLFAWSASFGPFIWEGEKSIYHYHIWKLDLYGIDLLYKRYLYTFLFEQTQKIKSAGHGVMMIHMTKEKMEKLIVYIPPLSEQRRIVAKIDELLMLCDQLKTRIQQANQMQKVIADTFTSHSLLQ